MGIFTGFEKGSGGRYVYDDKRKSFVKTQDTVPTNDYGFNGPVWFPKGGYKYFDKALQRTFHSKQEKKDFLKENKMVMAGDNKKIPRVAEAGLGKRYYSYGGQKICSKGYKYR